MKAIRSDREYRVSFDSGYDDIRTYALNESDLISNLEETEEFGEPSNKLVKRRNPEIKRNGGQNG